MMAAASRSMTCRWRWPDTPPARLPSLDDLEHVASLGFRGEALASISSVSRLTMTSRTADAAQAWQVESEGCRDAAAGAAGGAPGGHLGGGARPVLQHPGAAQVPAQAENQVDHLQEVIRRLALARFDVSFHLRHNGKTVLGLHEATDESARARRVASVCGPGFLEQALPIEL